MKKKLKELRAKKTRLEGEAAAKLKLITPETSKEDATRIEGEHATLTTQIQEASSEIGALEKKLSARREERRQALATLTRAGDEDGDADDDDDDGEDDDDSDDDDDKKKRKKRKGRNGEGDDDGDDAADRQAPTTLTRSQLVDMTTIDRQARDLGVDLGLQDAIQRNETPDAMRKRLFDTLAKRSKDKGPGTNTFEGNVQMGRDETDGRSAAMEVALITRVLNSRRDARIEYKPKDKKEEARVEAVRAQAQQFMGMSLVEIAASCINYRGRGLITAGMATDILTRAFESTSDFPNIFQNVLNKSLLARYELHMPTYREIAVERPFNDFRPHPQIRAGEFPQLQPVTETGELKYGTTSDDGETLSVTPYGIVFTISRQMLVNDDLGAIDQILGSAGDSVLVFENNTFFTMFTSNSGVGPTLLQDNTAVFAAGHGNYVASGSGAAPSVSTIGAARQALRGMKSLAGLYLNVPPRIILTGPAQETVADQMVASITPTLTTSVNPFSGRLRSVSDANITDGSWYLAAEPGRIPCFAYGFLNGASGPRVRTFEPFGVQGVKISMEHDFGCGAIDYRGFYKNAGS